MAETVNRSFLRDFTRRTYHRYRALSLFDFRIARRRSYTFTRSRNIFLARVSARACARATRGSACIAGTTFHIKFQERTQRKRTSLEKKSPSSPSLLPEYIGPSETQVASFYLASLRGIASPSRPPGHRASARGCNHAGTGFSRDYTFRERAGPREKIHVDAPDDPEID